MFILEYKSFEEETKRDKKTNGGQICGQQGHPGFRICLHFQAIKLLPWKTNQNKKLMKENFGTVSEKGKNDVVNVLEAMKSIVRKINSNVVFFFPQHI